MRRITKKDLNLNKLKTGCTPCLNEAKKMQQKLSNREISKIKFDVKLSDLNARLLSPQIK